MDFPIVTEFLNQFAQVLPRLVMAIVVLIFGILLAKLLAKILRKFLATLPIDKYGERLQSIDFIQKANLDIKPSRMMASIVYYFLLVVVFMIATEILQVAAISVLFADFLRFIPNLIVALIILFVGILLADALRKFVLTFAQSLNLPSANIIANGVFYFLLINIFVTALSQAGVSTTFLQGNIMILLGGGALAFAIGYGLASKDLVGNLLSAFYTKDKLVPGDVVTIDGITGTIVEIEKSSLVLDTVEGLVYIPMSKILKEKLLVHKKNLKKLN